MSLPKTLRESATEYRLSIKGVPIVISRKDNKGLIQGGKWCVKYANEFFLRFDNERKEWTFSYKVFTSFKDPGHAYSVLVDQHDKIPQSWINTHTNE